MIPLLQSTLLDLSSDIFHHRDEDIMEKDGRKDGSLISDLELLACRKRRNPEPMSLGSNYEPGPYDVICARGNEAWNHPGNRYFRSLIEEAHPRYLKATSKPERSIIVSQVVESVRRKGTGFVKYEKGFGDNKDDGQWIEIGDHLAREKVGHQFRNASGSKYRSSTQFKKKRRKEIIEKVTDSTREIVLSNAFVYDAIRKVTKDVRRPHVPDSKVIELFDNANTVILEALKRDPSILQRFRYASVS